MKFTNLFSLLYLLHDGGQGCFRLIGLGLIAIIFVLSLKFLYENFIIVLLICLIIMAMLEGIKLLKDYLKYKDEIPEQRTKRLKTEEMVKEWQKRYY